MPLPLCRDADLCHFNPDRDPDPAFHFYADPDPAPVPNKRRINGRTWHTAKEYDPIGQYHMQRALRLIGCKVNKRDQHWF